MATGRETVEKMFKLSNNPKLRTSITKVEPNRIITRGYSQEDLIGNISFPEMVYLLIKGNLPPKNESKMLEAVLVSFCDHGLTPPSTQVARLMASAGSPVTSCVSGGLMAFGKYHAGAMESTMKIFQETVKGDDEKGQLESTADIKAAAGVLVDKYLENEEKIPGFGHRYHTEDPRASKLIKLAESYGCLGKHTELALAIEDVLHELRGIRMNVDGANSGILSDMGFDWKVGTGIFMVGRLPAILSHVYEEKTNESPFRKFFEADELHYDGEEAETMDILKKFNDE